MPVLILGFPTETKDLVHAITAKDADVEFFYATTHREAQRQVRSQQFVAIVAPERGFVQFCVAMLPHLRMPGSILDVIVANLRGYDDLYGIVPYHKVEDAAAEVSSAINHQKTVDGPDRGAVAPISAPPIPHSPGG
jgi:hypothetical protein